jgi:hypothetical protein
MTKEQLKRKLIDIRNGAMITPLLEELTPIFMKKVNWGDNPEADEKQKKVYKDNTKFLSAAHELKLRNEGRDFFKKELLLDIERMEKKGYVSYNIVSAIINLLK